MSDEQEPCGYPVMDCALGVYVTKCENRIEELEAKLEAALEDADEVEAYAWVLEQRLGKAVKALVQMVGKKYYADDPWEIASTTLAELKGQADE